MLFTAASTSKMLPGNGMNSQQGSSGVQGGSRSEPLRPFYPAPSTIYPDDSASLQPSQTGSDTNSRRSVRQFHIPNYGPMSAQMPQGTPQATPYPAHTSASRGSQNQYDPPSFRSTPQENMGGASQSRLRAPSGMTESITRGSTVRAGAGMSTGATSQNRTVAPSADLPLNPNGPQLSQGMNMGVPAGTPMHFHYNQVDNRQVHVHNNAPRRMVTNNNQAYMTDSSNHHNTHAPQANTYNTHAANVGNTNTTVAQHGTDTHSSAYINSNGRQQGRLAPSESIILRSRQYKTVKKVSFNDWTDRRSVTYKDVVDDRPC